jgi:hypothetical protein
VNGENVLRGWQQGSDAHWRVAKILPMKLKKKIKKNTEIPPTVDGKFYADRQLNCPYESVATRTEQPHLLHKVACLFASRNHPPGLRIYAVKTPPKWAEKDFLPGEGPSKAKEGE